MFEKILRWDREAFVYLNSQGIDTFDTFWVVTTHTLSWIPLFVLIIYLIIKNYGKQKSKTVIRYFLVALFIGLALMLTTKYAIGRLRPSKIPEFEGLIRVLYNSQGFSFYSGHASASFLIATFAVLVLKKFYKWVFLFFLFPLLFSWSRIYVGVHYPSDLIVGAIIGMLIAYFFYRKLQTNLRFKEHE